MGINPNRQEELDDATAKRLARWGQRDVDASRLGSKLETAWFGGPSDDTLVTATPQPRTFRIVRRLRPAVAAAAVFALALTYLVFTGPTAPRASAAVLELSQLHHDLVAGVVDITPANSIEQANAWIATQQATAPSLPESLADLRVQSCCLVDVQGELAAVAVLDNGQATVTLVVAEAPGFAHEMGTVIEIDGRTFFGHELNGVQMMMANHGDRWLCVMGDHEAKTLAKIASQISF